MVTPHTSQKCDKAFGSAKPTLLKGVSCFYGSQSAMYCFIFCLYVNLARFFLVVFFLQKVKRTGEPPQGLAL